MRYEIALKIQYDYTTPADSGRQSLHLVPRSIPGIQTVLGASLLLFPNPSEQIDLVDFYGNQQSDIVFRTPHDSLTYRVTAQVERLGPGPSLDFSPELHRLPAEIESCRSLGPDQPHHFLGPSPRVPRHMAFSDYAVATIPPAATALQALIAIGEAIHRDMTFEPNATDANTPVLQAFENRHGVCQDFSHMMIACLRTIGIPAAYVSGFLRTTPPEGKERLEGADAMHAWVRAWCGLETGWVEYDPTNALMVDQHHIVVAYGRDYCDVAPVKGVLRSAGDQTTSHAVDVLPL